MVVQIVQELLKYLKELIKLFKFSFVCTALGAVTNISMNFFFIPLYGGIGAAFTTLFSFAISGLLTSIFLVGRSPVFRLQLLSLIAPRVFFKK